MTPEQMIGLYFDLARITEGVGQLPITTREISAKAMSEHLWAVMTPIVKLAKESGEPWNEDAVDEADSAMHSLAESGKTALEIHMSHEAVTELSRRCSHALFALLMEDREKTGYSFLGPADVRDAYIRIGIFIFLMMGIGRDYPRPELRQR